MSLGLIIFYSGIGAKSEQSHSWLPRLTHSKQTLFKVTITQLCSVENSYPYFQERSCKGDEKEYFEGIIQPFQSEIKANSESAFLSSGTRSRFPSALMTAYQKLEPFCLSPNRLVIQGASKMSWILFSVERTSKISMIEESLNLLISMVTWRITKTFKTKRSHHCIRNSDN